MSQEYTVKQWQPWREADGTPITDTHQNIRGSVTFEEDARQLDAGFKTDPSPGDKKYGDIESYKTQSGNSRVKFKAASRPFAGSQASSQSADPDFGYRCNALNNAVAHVANMATVDNQSSLNRTLNIAGEFYAWLTKTTPATQPEDSEARAYQESLAQELNQTFPPEE